MTMRPDSEMRHPGMSWLSKRAKPTGMLALRWGMALNRKTSPAALTDQLSRRLQAGMKSPTPAC